MKSLLLSALFFCAASSSLAASTIASCEVLYEGKVRDKMDIVLSDNGDEGVLHFKLKDLEFFENIFDEGAVFLKDGATKLYLSDNGKRSDGRRAKPAAVFLKNEAGKISGLLKAEIGEYDLRCEPLMHLL